MSEFVFYLKQGVDHILDMQGIDHMVFVITMCAFYRLQDWKKTLVLITAFTLGHSVTLILAGLDIIRVNQTFVETLIPITILATSIFNVAHSGGENRKFNLNYLFGLMFGLIHGMGFSNFFRSMMMGMGDDSIVMPLLSFNIGIEIGQIVIGLFFFLGLWVYSKVFKAEHKNWKLYVSGAGGGIAATMILQALL